MTMWDGRKRHRMWTVNVGRDGDEMLTEILHDQQIIAFEMLMQLIRMFRFGKWTMLGC